MRKMSIILIIVLITSCSKEEGNIVDSRGSKLVLIEYTNQAKKWNKNYFYNVQNQIIKIEDHRSLGRRYEIEYINEKISQIITYRIDIDLMVFRDSIEYNDQGKIDKIYNYSINSGEDLPLTAIYEFEYNNYGKPIKKTTNHPISGIGLNVEKYYWIGGNVIRVEKYRGDKLKSEYFFTYDNKINYMKYIPNYMTSSVIRNQNNSISSYFIDYTGLIDAICNPCESTYKYNLDNFPVEISASSGYQLKLTYK